MNALTKVIDDLGYAVLISLDYINNDEQATKIFFKHLNDELSASGFSFENRIFFKIGSKLIVEEQISNSLRIVKSQTNTDPKKFLRSIHLIPLSQFRDITQSAAAI